MLARPGPHTPTHLTGGGAATYDHWNGAGMVLTAKRGMVAGGCTDALTSAGLWGICVRHQQPKNGFSLSTMQNNGNMTDDDRCKDGYTERLGTIWVSTDTVVLRPGGFRKPSFSCGPSR